MTGSGLMTTTIPKMPIAAPKIMTIQSKSSFSFLMMKVMAAISPAAMRMPPMARTNIVATWSPFPIIVLMRKTKPRMSITMSTTTLPALYVSILRLFFLFFAMKISPCL